VADPAPAHRTHRVRVHGGLTPRLCPTKRAPMHENVGHNPRLCPTNSAPMHENVGHNGEGYGVVTFASGEIFTPGPIVDDVVMLLMYRPFAEAGFARTISSSTAP